MAVRFVVDRDESLADFTVVSGNLIPEGPYEGETLAVGLPEGITLDAVSVLSVWCVPFGADFGHLAFESLL